MIKIGTSGFQYTDWVGPVYPPGTQTKNMLAYYEKVLGFDSIELNYTYYSLPSQKTMYGLLDKTSDAFSFVVRSHKDMTHDIWTDKNRTQIKDTSDIFMKFMYGIKPLAAEGRLGCILLQFPYFFYPNPTTIEYLRTCRQYLPNIPVVVEFRNKAWVKEETFDFLRKNDLGFCVVDEPPLQQLMPAVFEATSDTGYFRLHGRNKNWFGAKKEERYNYNYSTEELQSFIPPVKKLNGKVKRLFTFFNNCTGGHAAHNARLIKELLGL